MERRREHERDPDHRTPRDAAPARPLHRRLHDHVQRNRGNRRSLGRRPRLVRGAHWLRARLGCRGTLGRGRHLAVHPQDPERWETVTVKAIGIAFFTLAAYVSIDAVLALVGQEGPDHSPLGLGITALSLVVMLLLAWIEVRTGRELGSKSVMADAKQLILCIYLSGAVFIGLVLDSLFGWWWADSVAALVVAVLAVREGLEAWRGDVESPFEVLRGPRRRGRLTRHPTMKSQCCNPDMRYENPLYMAELAAMADLIAAGRLQLGVDFNLKMLYAIVKEIKPALTTK